jgi:hypothetical protein
VATVARAVGALDALVAISQMTVSQMDAVSTQESHQHRLHWLSEQVLDWSGRNIRPPHGEGKGLVAAPAGVAIPPLGRTPGREA